MSAELLIANLLRVAKEDLDGARILSAQGNRNAIYLCEQAAEKIIRAVLSSEGTHAGVKHFLNDMVDQVPDESVRNVEAALNSVVAGFKVDLSKANAPAGSVTPLR